MGLITPGIRSDPVKIFKRNGGKGKPRYAEASVCWADSMDYAKNISYEYWPIVANENGLNWKLPTPKYFEDLAKMTDPETITHHVASGNDPQKHIDEIKNFIKAGYDHVFIHQLSPNQEGFIKFYEEEILPEFQ